MINSSEGISSQGRVRRRPLRGLAAFRLSPLDLCDYEVDGGKRLQERIRIFLGHFLSMPDPKVLLGVGY